MNKASRIVLGCLYLCFGVALSSSSNFTFSHTLRLSRQTNTKECRLPEHPNFGQWTIYERTARQVPGNSVPSATILEFSCQDGYKLDGEDVSTCIRGQWKPKISQCLQTCPTIPNTSFMTATCTFNEKPVQKCADAIEGTIARFSCAAYYEDLGLEANPYRLCSKGSWGKIPECVPVCGKKSSDPRLIVGGINTERGEYPWQVALYTAPDKSLICGGTLLNARIIVTAAHCVTDTNGTLLPKETYIVAAGKYFRKYDHPEDLNKTQFSPVSEIFIPRQYKGERQNYFGDIAVLVTEKTFVLSGRIQPICVDWGFRRSQILLNSVPTPHGFVTGWGFTVEYKNPSNILKVLEVPLIVDETECERKLPSDNQYLMTDDKICAGFLNSSASACKGDSGGGLVYEFGGRYYLLAVVSVSPPAQTQVGGCNSQQYTLYTNVSYYTERFILDKETRFRASAFGDLRCNYDPNCGIPRPATPIPEVITKPSTPIKVYCTAPSYPRRGKWSVVGKKSNTLSPGDSVGPGTTLIVHCDEEHIANGNNFTVCVNGTWTPYGRCSKAYCSPIWFIPNMKVTCIGDNTENNHCFHPSDGTLAKFECAPYYESLELLQKPTHVCQNGIWDRPTPICTPVCGRTNAEHPENYPWQVDIHSTEERCGGTLITEKLVLTSAMCMTDGKGTFLPKENFTVAAGISSNKNRTQYSGLQDIIIREEYQPDVLNSAGDIAILVLEKPFGLSANLQPICIDLAPNVETPKQGYGYIPMRIPVHNDPNVVVAKTLKASTFNASECFNKLPDEEKFTPSNDKYCAFIPHTGLLIFERGREMFEKYDGKFYILGIASLFDAYATHEDPQTTENVFIYTTVSKHLNNFIVSQVAKYKPKPLIPVYV